MVGEIVSFFAYPCGSGLQGKNGHHQEKKDKERKKYHVLTINDSFKEIFSPIEQGKSNQDIKERFTGHHLIPSQKPE